MKVPFTFLLIVIAELACNAQDKVYQKAYDFISKDSTKAAFINHLYEYPPCILVQENVTIKKPIFSENEVFVSVIKVANTPFLVLCSILKQDYSLEESCSKVIGLDYPLVEHVRDSINSVYQTYHLDEDDMVLKTPSLEVRDEGFLIFFSDVFKNTVYAELRYICDPKQRRVDWRGESIIFYFVFDEQINITKVLRGIKSYQ
jgi:hypothetical protein